MAINQINLSKEFEVQISNIQQALDLGVITLINKSLNSKIISDKIHLPLNNFTHGIENVISNEAKHALPKETDLSFNFQSIQLQQEFSQSLVATGANPQAAFLSVENLLFPFDGIFSAFQKALLSYLQIDEGSFITQLEYLAKFAEVQSVPNFLGLSFEQLFDVPVTEGGSEVTALTFAGGIGLVESIGVALNLNSSGSTTDIVSVMSEARTLSTPPIVVNTTVTTTPVTVTNPTSNPTPPTARDQTIDNVMSSALNFASVVTYTGNIFKASSYNGNLVATFGPDGGKTITADFVEAIPGSTVTHIRGATILTLPDGNYLTVYTANLNGHLIGDYVYTLVAPHLIANTTASIEIIDGQRFFIDTFEYTLTTNRFLSATAKITVIIQDDHPTANDVVGASPLMESSIPNIGSSLLTTPHTLIGTLITSATDANPIFFGANGGSITNVTLLGGSTIVDATTILVTDQYGNTFVIDRATGDYTYTLSHAVTNVNGDPLVEVFEYVLTDNNGNTASGKISISILDDKPVALAQDAGTILEANIPVVGSNDTSVHNVLGGDILADNPTTSSTRLGADGGVISSVSLQSISGSATTVSEASNLSGVITQQDIDNSQGALDASNLNHSSITVTDSLGNVLVVDTTTGEYFYTLNEAFKNSVPDGTVVLVFDYTLTDSDGSTDGSTLTIRVEDDHPVAVDQNAGTIEESHIPVVGSDAGSSTNTLGGTLDVHYGADGAATGGGVINVQFSGVNGADPITATTTFSQISQIDINNSNGTLSNANLGHSAILVTDSLGNTLLVDAITGQYVYTLNQAFNQTTPDTEAQVEYIISYKDSDGSETSNSLVLNVNDDHPIAVADVAAVTSSLPDVTLTLTSFPGDASANNSYGYYIKDANGNPTVGQIIWVGIKDVGIGATFTIPNVDPNNIGFFILPDGARANPTLTDGTQVVFQTQTNTNYDFANDTQWYPVDANTNQIVYGTDGVGNIVPMVIFDSAALNPYSSVGVPGYIIDVNGNQGWEDSIINQIYDYNDLIINSNYTFSSSVSVVGGNILSNDIQGADGAIVSSASLQSVSGSATPVSEVSNVSGVITQQNIDNSQGALDASNLNHSSITLTDSFGNVLVIDTITGDYFYTLNQTYPSSVANGAITLVFNYALIDSDGSIANSTLTIQINDTHPIVIPTDAGTLLEANIPIVGSNDSTTPNVIGGELKVYYGPDIPTVSGGITSITLTSVNGASVTEVSNVSGFITAQDILNSQGILDASSLNHPSITITDSLGNILVVDGLTGQYFYTLNHAFNNSTSGGSVDLIFSYVATDSDGSTANSTLTIHITDDHPIAVDQSAGTIEESHIPGVGSDAANTANTVSGMLNVHYGADGAATGGGVVNVQLNGVNGADPITATTTFGQISQTDIDNSNGSLTLANLGHNSIIVTDSLGNTLIVDAITNQYVYTLNKSLTQTTPDTEALLNYTISYRDADGSETSNTLTIYVNDDHPTAVPDTNEVSAPPLPTSEVTFGSTDAGYDNSFGYYIKDANGLPTTGVIIWAGSKETLPSSSYIISGVDPANIGYFIIPNGGGLNPLTNGESVTFVQVNGVWQAVATSTNQTIQGQGAAIYFDNTSLNVDGVSHVKVLSSNRFGWEDLRGGGDQDFNDLIVKVVTNNASSNPSSSQVSGNILTNDIRSADGNVKVTDISLHFSNAILASSYIASHPGLNATLNGMNVVVPIPDGGNVLLSTPDGATLQISSDGHYSYTASSGTALGTETFAYHIVDADNSASASTLSINVTAPLQSAVEPSTFVVSSLADTQESTQITSQAVSTAIVANDLFANNSNHVLTFNPAENTHPNGVNIHHSAANQMQLSAENVAEQMSKEANPLMSKEVFLDDNTLNFTKIDSLKSHLPQSESANSEQAQQGVGNNVVSQPTGGEDAQSMPVTNHVANNAPQASPQATPTAPPGGEAITEQLVQHLVHNVHHGG